ncbi:MAG: MTAP family purine nucleoside phosphorylase [Methanospirillum sp.]
MLAIVGGTSLLDCPLPPFKACRVSTPFGPASVLAGDDFLLLLRHGNGRPPHRINHRANLAALALLGADRIVLVGSTGSLRAEHAPGSLLVPTDYATTSLVPTIHDRAIVHVCPGFSNALSRRLAALVPGAHHGGVYVQTPGPRLETQAEVHSLATYADVVGMTCASEAALANELELEVAALCTVENYANGLDTCPVSFEAIVEAARSNADRMAGIVQRLVEEL